MDNDFYIYAQKRIEFYNQFSLLKISDFDISEPIYLKNELFKKFNIEFSDFLKRRSENVSLSTLECKEFNDLLIMKHPEFKEIFDYQGPAVYWFKIIHFEKSTNNNILKKYINVRTTQNGWWSKPGNDKNNNSEYLYIGKIEKNLKNRFIQHLGFGHKMTSSLKLCKWFSKLNNVDLEYQFIKIQHCNLSYLEDIENVLWRKYNPLIGAEPKIK